MGPLPASIKFLFRKATCAFDNTSMSAAASDKTRIVAEDGSHAVCRWRPTAAAAEVFAARGGRSPFPPLLYSIPKDGGNMLVYKDVCGQDLQKLLNDHPAGLPFALLCKVAQDCIRAIGSAHSAGIVCGTLSLRSVKNVFVTQFIQFF